ncbi:hypothetical protein BOX15_Mlig026125g4, partial [Macrostomum lignano]
GKVKKRAKRFRYHTNRKRQWRNKQTQSTEVLVSDADVQAAWQAGSSARSNFSRLGLCYDPGVTFGVPKPRLPALVDGDAPVDDSVNDEGSEERTEAAAVSGDGAAGKDASNSRKRARKASSKSFRHQGDTNSCGPTSQGVCWRTGEASHTAGGPAVAGRIRLGVTQLTTRPCRWIGETLIS